MKWKRIKTTHNSKWIPTGEGRTGKQKYRKFETRGGSYKWKRSRVYEDYSRYYRLVDNETPLNLAYVGLKKAWIAFYIYLKESNYDMMEFYARIIQSIQEKLDIPVTYFPLLEGGEKAQDDYYKWHRYKQFDKNYFKQ